MRIGRHSRGFTLIAVLVACMLLALATQGVMFVLSQQAQRERELQLLRIGEEFVRAIGSYYQSSPGSLKRFPSTLDELTEDRRFVGIKRHLRQVYRDPITGSTGWGLVTNSDGSIEGVYSTSETTPIRSGELDWGSLHFPPAATYRDWKFVYVPPIAPRHPVVKG